MTSRQILYFFAAGTVGLLLFVVLPGTCARSKYEYDLPDTVAPAPGPIRRKNHDVKSSPSPPAASATMLGNAPAASGPDLRQAKEFREQAIELLGQSADSETRGGALEQVIRQWAAADLPSLLAWAEQLPASEQSGEVAMLLGEAWAEKDPKAAAAWLVDHPKLATHGGLGGVIGVWGQSNPAEAAQWLGTIANDEVRGQAASALASAWAEHDPAAAAAWWKGLPEATQALTVSGFLSGWAQIDPAAAAQWFHGESQSNPALAADKVGIVVSAWVEKAPSDVSKWLNALPDGPIYDEASNAFALTVARISPKDAFGWAKALSSPERRAHAVGFVLDSWHESDADGLRQAMPAELEKIQDPALKRTVLEKLQAFDPEFQNLLINSAGSE